MSRSKKIVGLVLAVVLMLGSLTMAFAATDPGAGNYTATVAVTPAAASIAAGESTTVSVKATTNFTVGALSVPLFYEKANVTLSNIAVPATAGYAYSTDATAKNAASVFASAGLDSATYGFVMVTYIPEAGAATRVFADEQVLSFTVTANAGVADGTAVNFKTVEASRKTSTNPTGTLYVGFINSDTINAVPTNIEATGLVTSSTVTIGSAMTPADLAIKAGATAGVIIDTHKTFGGQYDGVVYGFTLSDSAASIKTTTMYTTNLEATNGGSLSFTPIKVGRYNCYGTGATIQVKNSDGTLSKTYVIVIFGDLNSDGAITAADTGLVYAHQKGKVALANDVLIMAANTKVEGRTTGQKQESTYTVSPTDTGFVFAHTKGKKLIDQASAAAFQNSYNASYQ